MMVLCECIRNAVCDYLVLCVFDIAVLNIVVC